MVAHSSAQAHMDSGMKAAKVIEVGVADEGGHNVSSLQNGGEEARIDLGGEAGEVFLLVSHNGGHEDVLGDRDMEEHERRHRLAAVGLFEAP